MQNLQNPNLENRNLENLNPVQLSSLIKDAKKKLKEVTGETISESTPKISPYWSILTKARKSFDKQLFKSNELKMQCLDFHKSANGNLTIIENFSRFFDAQIDTLMDSKKYALEAIALDYNPEILAEHIVLLGSGAIKKVLKNGIENSLGLDLQHFKESFMTHRMKKDDVKKDTQKKEKVS